jgi:hypothetical protein
MNCLEIIKKHLKDNGFDGLCNPDAGCGCHTDDLICCSEDFSDCNPGYKGPSGEDDGSDFWIYATKVARDRAIDRDENDD